MPGLRANWCARQRWLFARRYKIPYFVHLEDNETIVLLDELPGWSREDLEGLPVRALDAIVSNHRAHPHRSRRFLAGAAGITALIDRLLEFKRPDVPGMVFFPGYDAGFAKIEGRDEGLRETLSIHRRARTVYSGNIHNSNFQEVRSLLLAVALVNRRGFRVKLIKTGWNLHVLPEQSDPEIARHIIDRGFVTRSEIPALIAAADVLVQPGRSNEFNDFRFPSKLPEFLASGRPVILPRSNIGLLLKDGEDLLLSNGNCAQIADALQRLAIDPELRAKIGHGGRAFALRNLDSPRTSPHCRASTTIASRKRVSQDIQVQRKNRRRRNSSPSMCHRSIRSPKMTHVRPMVLPNRSKQSPRARTSKAKCSRGCPPILASMICDFPKQWMNRWH